METAKKSAHMTALTNIEVIILRFGIPNDVKSMVPPIGVRKMGVKAAMPYTPNFCQILIIFLVLLVNLLVFFRIFIVQVFLIQSPKYVNATTEVIMPATVTTSISKTEKPAAAPRTGPAINLKRHNR